MRSALLIASFVLALASTAAAQPSATPPPPSPLPSAPPPDSSAPPPSTPLPVQPPGAAPPSSTPLPVQPPGTTPPPSTPPPTQPPDGPLSESTALMLSLGGTAGSWTLLLAGGHGHAAASGLAGTLLAPSFGHWYAGSFATRGLGLRTLGAAGFLLVLSGVSECEDDCSSPVLEGVALVSLGLYIAGTLDDVFTAPGEARDYNQRFHNLSVVPMVRPGAGGLALTGRF